MTKTRSRWLSLIGIGVFAVLLLAVAPLVLTDHWLSNLGKYCCWAIAAVGIGLAWGRGGMLVMGQGVFFALGAYSMAMHLTLETAGDGVPGFMILYDPLAPLPAFWEPFRSDGVHPAGDRAAPGDRGRHPRLRAVQAPGEGRVLRDPDPGARRRARHPDQLHDPRDRRRHRAQRLQVLLRFRPERPRRTRSWCTSSRPRCSSCACSWCGSSTAAASASSSSPRGTPRSACASSATTPPTSSSSPSSVAALMASIARSDVRAHRRHHHSGRDRRLRLDPHDRGRGPRRPRLALRPRARRDGGRLGAVEPRLQPGPTAGSTSSACSSSSSSSSSRWGCRRCSRKVHGGAPEPARTPPAAATAAPGARGGEDMTARRFARRHRPPRRVRSGFVAVGGVSFDAHPGEVRFLIGPNGAGKTTCIDAITGLSKATGSAKLGEQELLGRPVHKIVRLGVGRTFQTASVFDELSVLQNLDIAAGLPPPLGSRCCGPGAASTRRSMRRWRRPDSPASSPRRPASCRTARSSGWRSRCCSCRTPRVLLLDEPVAGMSQDERTATGELLQRIAANAHRAGRRARHGLHAPLRHARDGAAPGQGALARHGGRGAGRPQGAGGLPRHRGSRDHGRHVGRARARQPTRCGSRHASRRRTDMLELTDIEAGYGRTRVLHGVTVPAGKVVAVLGHNGAGKTTLLRVAIGLIKPRSGQVFFDGEDVTSLAPNKRVARGMAYVPQGQQSFGQLTTMENLQLVADGRRRGKALIDAAAGALPRTGEVRQPARPACSRAASASSSRSPAPSSPSRSCSSSTSRPRASSPRSSPRSSTPSCSWPSEGLTVLLVEQHIGFALEAAEQLPRARVGLRHAAPARGARQPPPPCEPPWRSEPT